MPPVCPYKIMAKLYKHEEEIALSIPLILSCLFVEGGKLTGKPFVDFFSENKDKIWNGQSFIFENSQLTEDNLTKKFEQNNIFLVAKQNKFDPPLIYYSMNISQVIPGILECSFVKGGNGQIKVRFISNVECISPFINESLYVILG